MFVLGYSVKGHKASIRYIDLLEGSYNGDYPPENVLDSSTLVLKGFGVLHPKTALFSGAGPFHVPDCDEAILSLKQ